MYASVIDLVRIVLRNALFIVWQGVVVVTFMFLVGGVLFMLKWKKWA